MSNDEPTFTLFAGIDPEKVNRPCIAAALQAFETNLYLIGMGRWPAVITQLYLSIELLLRAYFEKSPNTEVKSFELIDRYGE